MAEAEGENGVGAVARIPLDEGGAVVNGSCEERHHSGLGQAMLLFENGPDAVEIVDQGWVVPTRGGTNTLVACVGYLGPSFTGLRSEHCPDAQFYQQFP